MRVIKFLLIILIFLIPTQSLAILTYTNTQIRGSGGTDATHIVIQIISSGFASGADQITSDTLIRALDTNLFVSGSTPGTNPFYTNASSFNIWMTKIEAPTSGIRLTLVEIQAVQAATGIEPDIIFVLHNISETGGTQVYNGSINGYTVVWEFYLLDQAYQINHEAGHGIVLKTPNIGQMRLADEYTTPTSDCVSVTVRHSFNLHDNYSNEKWSALEVGAPSMDGNKCLRSRDHVTVFRPTNINWMTTAENNIGFNGPSAKAVDFAIKKHTKIASVESTIPTLTVPALVEDATVSGNIQVGANVTDISGIERIEFYIRRYDSVSWEGRYSYHSRKIHYPLRGTAGDHIKTPPNLRPGSNPSYIAHDEFSYVIGGVTHTKAANSVGINPTGTTVTYDYTRAIALDIGADEVIDIIVGTDARQTFKEAIASLAGPAAGHVRIGTVSLYNYYGHGTFGTTDLAINPELGSTLFESALTWTWKTYLYPNGDYQISVISFDENWNMNEVITKVTVWNPVLGKGCTNAYVIDDDCDGYGPGSELGPDADDTNAEVNVSSTVFDSYADIPTFLSTVKGYSCTQYIVIDPINGSDPGTRSASIDTALASPYKTWGSMKSSIGTGDCIIFRYGSFDANMYNDSHATGTITNPIYFIPFPGEQVIFRTSSGSDPVFSLNPQTTVPTLHYWTIDGMGGGIVFDGEDYRTNVLGFGSTGYVTYKEIEVRNSARACRSGHYAHNLTFSRNVFHAFPIEHIFYFTSFGPPVSSQIQYLTIDGNLIYGGINHGIKLNSSFSDITIQKNIFHHIAFAAVNLEQGPTDNVNILNNLMFDNLEGLSVNYTVGYADEHHIHDGYNNFPINNVIFENNTVYHGKYRGGGNTVNNFPIFNWTDEDSASNALASVWLPNHAYDQQISASQSNAWAKPTTGYLPCIYACSVAGTSGGTEPNWTLYQNSGDSVTDGGVIWIASCKPTLTGHIVRNNILYVYDSTSIFTYDTEWLPSDYATIENNVIYNTSTAKIMILPDTSVLNFTNFELEYEGWRNNINGDPLFSSTNDTAWNYTPWLYNLTTLTNSPAKDAGLATGMPVDDIKGNTRVGYDIGAYEIYTAPPPSHDGIISGGATFR